MRRKVSLFVLISSLVLFLFLYLPGCSDSGGSSGTTDSGPLLTGRFINSPVENLYYETDSSSGFTNEKGEFTFRENETVEFSINKRIILGETHAGELIRPADLVDETHESYNTIVINIGRLLQSLDENQDLSDGIRISDETNERVAQVTDFSEAPVARAVSSQNAALSKQLTTTAQNFEIIRQEDLADENVLVRAWEWVKEKGAELRSSEDAYATLANGHIRNNVITIRNIFSSDSYDRSDAIGMAGKNILTSLEIAMAQVETIGPKKTINPKGLKKIADKGIEFADNMEKSIFHTAMTGAMKNSTNYTGKIKRLCNDIIDLLDSASYWKALGQLESLEHKLFYKKYELNGQISEYHEGIISHLAADMNRNQVAGPDSVNDWREETIGLLQSIVGVIEASIKLQLSDVTADAGSDVTASEGDLVTLDGRNSDGEIHQYEWEQVSGPAVVLQNRYTDSPQFIASGGYTAISELTFLLIVTDYDGSRHTDFCKVSVVSDPKPGDGNGDPDPGTPPDPGITMDDFVGNWSGNLTYEMGSEYFTGDLGLGVNKSGGKLRGAMELDDGGGDDEYMEGIVSDGKWLFEQLNSDPDHPDCANWDVTGVATLNEDRDKMEINAEGIFCGSGGGKFGSYEAVVDKIDNKDGSNEVENLYGTWDQVLENGQPLKAGDDVATITMNPDGTLTYREDDYDEYGNHYWCYYEETFTYTSSSITTHTVYSDGNHDGCFDDEDIGTDTVSYTLDGDRLTLNIPGWNPTFKRQ